MTPAAEPPSPPPGSWRTVVWILVGAALGFGLAYANYLWLNPVLEARTDWLRELQGLLFTSILVATVVGGVVGWQIAAHGRGHR